MVIYLLEFNFLIVVLCNLENNKWIFLHNNTKEKNNNVKNREFLYLPAQCNLETQKDIIYFLRSQPSTRIQKEFPLYFTSAGLLLTQQPYLRILTLFTMAKFTCLYLQICYDFTDFHDKVHLSS